MVGRLGLYSSKPSCFCSPFHSQTPCTTIASSFWRLLSPPSITSSSRQKLFHAINATHTPGVCLLHVKELHVHFPFAWPPVSPLGLWATHYLLPSPRALLLHFQNLCHMPNFSSQPCLLETFPYQSSYLEELASQMLAFQTLLKRCGGESYADTHSHLSQISSSIDRELQLYLQQLV